MYKIDRRLFLEYQYLFVGILINSMSISTSTNVETTTQSIFEKMAAEILKQGN